MAIGAVVARILTQYSDKGSKAASKDITKLGANFDKFAKKSARAFGIAAVASAAFAVKLGTDAVKAAIADQKSQVMLANTLRNTTGATNDAMVGVENYITQLQKQFSVVDDDLRPAMARLSAMTSDIASAQSLMSTALDVSASSGVDLSSAVGAIIKASSGQFRALKTLVPSLSLATIKSKNFGAALDEVAKATSGAAGKRAQTLEFRLKGMKIAFGEVLETLGYALLPVLEKFATTLQTKLIPQFETFIAMNKDRLAEGFRKAADFGLKFFTVAVAFGNWVVNNMNIVKSMGVLIAGMFAVGRIAAFVSAITTVTKAMAALRLTAAGAAIAVAFATGGVSAVAGAVGAATVVAGVGALTLNQMSKNNGKKANANNAMSNNFPMSPGAGDVVGGKLTKGKSTGTLSPVAGALGRFVTSLNGATKATKSAKSLQDQITAKAVRENLARQASISGSSSIAIGAAGSRAYAPAAATSIVVHVAGSVSTENDLIASIQNGIQRTYRRGRGSQIDI